jgi:ubiquinol-cytochrome c reductase iron-sulfur subunit
MSVQSSVEVSEEPDHSRRKFLTNATLAVGAVGAVFVAVPFVESWLPSERARAQGGPVKLDTSKIDPGQMTTLVWRLKPIYIVRRTPAMLARLGDHDARLKDPKSEDSNQPSYAKNAVRARRADLFVTIGICTHLGCLPKARFAPDEPQLGVNWPGGFFCPCHGSRFDLAGRVFDGSPASVNLVIPPYALADEWQLVVGTDDAAKEGS